MATRNVPYRIGHRQHRESECQGDALKSNPKSGECCCQYRAAASTEHQPKGPRNSAMARLNRLMASSTKLS